MRKCRAADVTSPAITFQARPPVQLTRPAKPSNRGTPPEYADAAAEIRVRPAVCGHTLRQGSPDGSVSAKLTGPVPQIAMTAGSFWLRMTPS